MHQSKDVVLSEVLISKSSGSTAYTDRRRVALYPIHSSGTYVWGDPGHSSHPIKTTPRWVVHLHNRRILNRQGYSTRLVTMVQDKKGWPLSFSLERVGSTTHSSWAFQTGGQHLILGQGSSCMRGRPSGDMSGHRQRPVIEFPLVS